MKALNAIMHAVYAVAVVGILVFAVAGVVPKDMDNLSLKSFESMFNYSIGAECEYPVTDSEKILEDNLRLVMDEVKDTVHVTQKGETGDLAKITVEGKDTEIGSAVTAIKNLESIDAKAIIVLKGADDKVLTQSMIFRDTDEISVNIYTEITINNGFRYDLKDIYIGVDLLNGDTVDYRILRGGPVTIRSGESVALPISLKVNMVGAMLTMMSGKGETMDIRVGLDISGKYYFGLAGASVYLTLDVGAFGEMPSITITKDITDKKIDITVSEKMEDFIFDLPDEVHVTVGGLEITLKNNDTDGLSLLAETDGVKTIVEALKEMYEDGIHEDYNIEVEIGGTTETIPIDKDTFAQIIDIVESIMEAWV